MFVEIYMRIHTLLFALSRQINKQKYTKTINLLCGFNPPPFLAYALGTEYKLKYQPSKLGYRRKMHSTLRHSSS